MRTTIVLAMSLICQFGFAQETPPILDRAHAGIQSNHTNLNTELKAKIISMAFEDQIARSSIVDVKNISDQQANHLMEIEANHNLRLKEIVSTYGWPGTHLVGLTGANSFWLLVQHQDHDLEFQKQCLILLQEAAAKQDAALGHYAYLLDRVRKNENLPQVYGTQWEFKDKKCFLYPVEAPENLNERRLEAGLVSIEEYREQMQKFHALQDADIVLFP